MNIEWYFNALHYPLDSLVRCVGSFIGDTRRFQIHKMTLLNENDMVLMHRLEALTHFMGSKK